MSLRISILGAIALAGQSVSANWGIGWCDPFGPETKKDFEIERYAGNWYNIKYEKGYVGGKTKGWILIVSHYGAPVVVEWSDTERL